MSIQIPQAAPSDTELLLSARSDPRAFETLFERHAVALRGWLFAQTGVLAVANDLVAETFAQAWLSVRRFRGDGSSSGAAWLYSIARHLLHQHYKRGRVEAAGRRRLGIAASASYSDSADDIVGRIDAQALSHEVYTAFAQLTPDQRRAIGFRVVEEMSYGDVAARLNCSPESARAHVSRGLRALRITLKGART